MIHALMLSVEIDDEIDLTCHTCNKLINVYPDLGRSGDPLLEKEAKQLSITYQVGQDKLNTQIN